jgi:hypothetical protein
VGIKKIHGEPVKSATAHPENSAAALLRRHAPAQRLQTPQPILEELSMTERSAPAVQHGPSSPTAHADTPDALAHTRLGATVEQRAAGQTHQPMTLAAVLRHVLSLDRGINGGIRAAGAPPMSHGEPLASQPLVASSPDAALAVADEPALRRVNDQLNATLDICLQLDTARLQLQNAISTQREMETVLEMVAARVEAGQALQTDHRRITTLLMAERDKVSEAVREWNRIGRRFTQHTRLLPAQLESVVDTLGPLPADEMDRLAEACLWTHADVHFSLRQRARPLADARPDVPLASGRASEDFHAWISRMEEVRAQAAADFSSAREAYLESVLNLDREHAGFVRARSLRRTAETGFRHGSGSALRFTDAIAEEGRRMHAVLALQARRLAAKHHLFALAGLLPKQFGLVGPLTWH